MWHKITLVASLLASSAHGQVNFFVSPGPAADGDLAWQAAATASGASLAEFDFEQYGDGDLVAVLGALGLTVDLELLDINNVVQPNGPTTFESANYFTFPDVIWHQALLNRSDSSPNFWPRLQLSFSCAVAGFGTWIFDDHSPSNQQFVIHVELVGGQVFTSPVLDWSPLQGVDGFLGVTAPSGIVSVVIEVQDTSGVPAPGIPFELDHMQMAWDESVGVSYCGPAVSNSSGQPGLITASGPALVADNCLVLTASQMPTNQFGYFLNSQTQASTFPVPNSQGVLCVGGAIGRYNLNVFNTGSVGVSGLQLDLANTPTPTGTVAIQVGETWNFTAWFRDLNPTQTSNFTNGVSVTFL